MKKSTHFIWTLPVLSFITNIQKGIICSKIVYSKGVNPQLPEVKKTSCTGMFGNGKFCMKSNDIPAIVLSSLHTLVTESNVIASHFMCLYLSVTAQVHTIEMFKFF